MENIVATLGDHLLLQDFDRTNDQADFLNKALEMARLYTSVEKAIAVVSDLRGDKSYIFLGNAALTLGLSPIASDFEINSIWEEDIFKRIHPEDLHQKHMQELQFFHFLKGIPPAERGDYYVSRLLRMLDKTGHYVSVVHRMHYLCNETDGNTELALCLYSFQHFAPQEYRGWIINASTGEVLNQDHEHTNILSGREQQVLSLIAKGHPSKEIAGRLCISVNTVNRHRQNILEKLRVGNSIEACRIAASFNWI